MQTGRCNGGANNVCCVEKVVASATTTPAGSAGGGGTHTLTAHIFNQLLDYYPKGDASHVKADIGGKINAGWITNTCVIRVSRALNLFAYHSKQNAWYIPRRCGGGCLTVSGAYKEWYALRVVEFKPLMNAWFGAPVECSPQSGHCDGRRGIIMFDTRGAWDDATGHFDLYDGRGCSSKCYWSEAVAVYLWPVVGEAAAIRPSASSNDNLGGLLDRW
eukprot:g5623.t1